MSKNKYKVPSSVKNTIKTELYQFWRNQELLEELKQDIISDSPVHDGQPTGKGSTSNPVEQKAMKIVSSRRILETERRVNYIKDAMKRLDKYELEVVILIFRDKYNSTLAYTQRYISKDVYYNIYNKIIYYVAQEFGYI